MTVARHKTLVGVLASRDSIRKNAELANLFEELYTRDPGTLARYHFIFSGGTFDRIVLGRDNRFVPIQGEANDFLRDHSTRLPPFNDGGITVLAALVVQRRVRTVICFLDPVPGHWLVPENVSLLRLCDISGTRLLLNRGSAEGWYDTAAGMAWMHHQEETPPKLRLPGSRVTVEPVPQDGIMAIPSFCDISVAVPKPTSLDDMTIAFIAPDSAAERVLRFAQQNERILKEFGLILATGATARTLADHIPEIEGRIFHYRSGPRGGDVEIAVEILYSRCHAVIFFVDPLEPQPHPEDLRTLIGACVVQNQVQTLTNEQHAQSWMTETATRHGL